MLKRTLFFSIFFFLGALGINQITVALAQDGSETNEEIDPQLVEYCKTAECRTDLNFVLRLEDGMGLEYAPALAPPAVNDGFLIIYPGEELFIEAEKSETGPINLKLVKENTNPERTFIFKFFQSEGTDMMLSVTNPFDKMLKYQALMVLPEDGNLYETSSCAVMAGLMGFEMWPQPIFQLIIADMKFVEPTDSIVCK
ncbi:MAG: hypothetical protein V3R64_02795 [Sphingomonadales bacterium]